MFTRSIQLVVRSSGTYSTACRSDPSSNVHSPLSVSFLSLSAAGRSVTGGQSDIMISVAGCAHHDLDLLAVISDSTSCASTGSLVECMSLMVFFYRRT